MEQVFVQMALFVKVFSYATLVAIFVFVVVPGERFVPEHVEGGVLLAVVGAFGAASTGSFDLVYVMVIPGITLAVAAKVLIRAEARAKAEGFPGPEFGM